ncbi:MAG: iron-sulfur cluster assembly scaffold protein [Vicinamibacterales bacterium]
MRHTTMNDYIDRGLRRRRRAALPIAGAARSDDAGHFAKFSLRLDHGVVKEVAFEASLCVTLIAYCEVAAERATGLAIREAAQRVGPEALAVALPLVPAHKRDRAFLAAQALAMALGQSVAEGSA